MNFIVKLADYSWQKVIAIALVVAAAYYWLQFDNGSAIEAAIAQQKTELQQENELLRKTEAAMQDLERFKEELANQEAQVKEVLSFLPKQMNISELMLTVQDRARQAGLESKGSQPLDEIQRVEFYETMKIEVNFQGTFPQIASFLSLLSKLPRLVTIERISLVTSRSPGESSKVDFSATLVGYRYAEDTKVANEGTANANKTGQAR